MRGHWRVWFAALVAGGSVVAGCAPPPPLSTTTTTTIPSLPPGAVDPTGGLIAEAWRVGLPVDVALYWPGHPQARFTLVDGSLPPGIDLVDERFVGTPAAAGFYFARINLADGSVAQTANVRFGVVGPSPVPTWSLPINPLRDRVVADGCIRNPESDCPYVESESGPGYFDASEVNPSPQYTYGRPEFPTFDYSWIERAALIGGSYAVGNVTESGDCLVGVFSVQTVADSSLPPIGEIHAGLTEARRCVVLPSADGSMQVALGVGSDPSGSMVTRLLFVRSSDATVIRMVELAGEVAVSLSADRSTVFFTQPASGSVIESITSDPSNDRSYEVGDQLGRQCGASDSFVQFAYLRVEARGRLAVSCSTPSQGTQFGYLDTGSGALRLGEMMPGPPLFSDGLSDPDVVATSGWEFPTASISEDGTQVAAIGLRANGRVTCIGWPGQLCFRQANYLLLYLETDGDGSVREAFPTFYGLGGFAGV